jgi:glycosyltransferase involved in cell wall biosynthesis
MKVSVYVPCFNGERHIAMCIASLLVQSRRPEEIIVVDDGSTDASAAIAASYPVTLIRHERNLGLAAARNTALAAATGDIIASIDADCFAMRGWLDRLVRTLEKNPKVVGAAGRLIEANYRTLADRWRTHHLAQHHGAKLIVNPLFLHGANTAFRRAALLAIGGYSVAFRTNGEDFDICFRLRRRDPSRHLVYDPRPLVMHLREDTIASVIRTRFRYLFYPQAIYTPCNSWGRLRNQLKQVAKANWVGLKWDLRNRRGGLAVVSAACLVYVSAKLIGEYVRLRRARTRPSDRASEGSAGESGA